MNTPMEYPGRWFILNLDYDCPYDVCLVVDMTEGVQVSPS